MNGFFAPPSRMLRIRFVLPILALLIAGPVGPGVLVAQSPSAYEVVPSESYLIATLDRSGIFSFASHRHAILAREWTADLRIDPNSLPSSTGSIVIPARFLVADTEEARSKAGIGSGPGADDVREIQERMLGPEVLDVDRYPEIRFEITSIESTAPQQFQAHGTFHLHGRAREITVPVRSRPHNTTGFVFEGSFTVKQTDFGMTPVTVAGGTVRVKDEMKIAFRVAVARR